MVSIGIYVAGGEEKVVRLSVENLRIYIWVCMEDFESEVVC